MSARIIKINGPLVICDQPELFSMSERVAVGDTDLIGEVIRIESDHVAIQVYEDTTGLHLGEPVAGSGSPLAVELGPGLLGGIFDGIQRPLIDLYKRSGDFIGRGMTILALDRERAWPFSPLARVGMDVEGGAIIGEVNETSFITHKVLLPSDCRGSVISMKDAGDYRVDEPLIRIKTPRGDEREISMLQRWPVRIKRPIRERLPPTEPLITGQRIIDTFFPIARGGSAAIPGGFGTGKTITQHNLAKWCDADIIVYIGCGERGNEMTGVVREFPQLTDPLTGHPLLERTVMIANTSNMPVAAREASIYTGITIAEYFRDQGFDVALMADSTSRWAEALREISGRLEEMPAEEGFPAYLPTRTAEFYERAGRVRTLAGGIGSVSAIGAVSPPGGDFSEPVTLHTRRFVKTYWALDKDLANARFFPAINPLESHSEYLEDLGEWWSRLDDNWLNNRDEVMRILLQAEQLSQVVRIMGEEGLPDEERKVLIAARLIRDAFLQQSAFSEKDRFASPQKQVKMLALVAATVHSILGDSGPAEEMAEKYRLSEMIRLKDEVSSEDLDVLDKWQV